MRVSESRKGRQVAHAADAETTVVAADAETTVVAAEPANGKRKRAVSQWTGGSESVKVAPDVTNWALKSLLEANLARSGLKSNGNLCPRTDGVSVQHYNCDLCLSHSCPWKARAYTRSLLSSTLALCLG